MAETTKTTTTETKTTTAADTPAPQPSVVHPAFSYPVVKKFTGKIQFRTNGPAEGMTPYGLTLRGEVKAVQSEKVANGLVANGDHAHVAADTPVGQPDEFKPSVSKQAVPGVISKAATAVKAAVSGALSTDKSEAKKSEPSTDTTK